MLRDAYASYTFAGTPFSLRGGQMVGRSVFMLPMLTGERLIDGPAAAEFMSFQDNGLEVAGQHGLLGWALHVMSGAGANRPDNNDDKDVMLSLALGPFGPLSYQIAFQAGHQPDGFRMRAAAHAVGTFGPVTVDLLATCQQVANEISWAASGMIGWRIRRALDIDLDLDLAAGYDEIHRAGSPDDRVVRAQLTAHLFDDSVELAAAYRWSQLGGHAGLARLQASF